MSERSKKDRKQQQRRKRKQREAARKKKLRLAPAPGSMVSEKTWFGDLDVSSPKPPRRIDELIVPPRTAGGVFSLGRPLRIKD